MIPSFAIGAMNRLSRSQITGGLVIIASIVLAVDGVVVSDHELTAIALVCVALLMYVAALWIWLEHRTRRRGLVCASLATFIVIGSFGWVFVESRAAKARHLQFPTVPTSTVRQDVPGAGGVAISGNGNSVTTQTTPGDAKKGSKK